MKFALSLALTEHRALLMGHTVPHRNPPTTPSVRVTARFTSTPPPHRCTCCAASPLCPAARSLSAGLTESQMPLSSSAVGSSLSESDPHVESHSSTVLGSLKRQLPTRFPIYNTCNSCPLLLSFCLHRTLHR